MIITNFTTIFTTSIIASWTSKVGGPLDQPLLSAAWWLSTQKQPSFKKRCGLMQNGLYEKSCEIQLQVVAKKCGCDGRSVKKILITNLCYIILASLGIGTKFTELSLKFLSLTYIPSQPFLGRHLYFTTYFILAILHRATPFFKAWLFMRGYHIFL